jgi:hypothetical protein
MTMDILREKHTPLDPILLEGTKMDNEDPDSYSKT